MQKKIINPLVIKKGGKSRRLNRIPRFHQEFNENDLQELLVDNPEILPAYKLREDVGELLCIGREVAAGKSGSIDNLFVSTGGYPVIVETKLWRNPQARREVLSQALDYTKEMVHKDFEWFESIWKEFSFARYNVNIGLIEKLAEDSNEEIEDAAFIDKFNRALRKGDILTLIVGDGIETRLQNLVSHLCKDSAHLRYSLALVELSCFSLENDEGNSELLVIPRIIQEVEPIQRAYVRIELPTELETQLNITSAAENESTKGSGYTRTILSEDEFLSELDIKIGRPDREKVEAFYQTLLSELELEQDFKSAALILKLPHPEGDKSSLPLLNIEKRGRMYHSQYLRGKMIKYWGFSEEKADSITEDFWEDLHRIDSRFIKNGLRHVDIGKFLPLKEIIDKLPNIQRAVSKVVKKIRSECEEP